MKEKVKILGKKIRTYIEEKYVQTFYALIIITLVVFWVAPFPVVGKIYITLYLLLMFPINFLTCPIFDIYLLFYKSPGIWNYFATITSAIILIIYTLIVYIAFKDYDKQSRKNAILKIISFVLIITLILIPIIKIKNNTDVTYDYSDTQIELVYLSDYVSPGEMTYIKIKGTPNTEFEISVEYNSGFSTAQGLQNKFSNDKGYVDWSWKVGTNTKSGSYPITIYNLDTLEGECFYFTVS